MKIVLTEFAKRHFDPTRAGTVITDRSPEEFEQEVNRQVVINSFPFKQEVNRQVVINSFPFKQMFFGRFKAGYAPFCKLLFLTNWTNANRGTLPTAGNEKFLKSGYLARTDGELPVLTRWLECNAPKATFLCIVLYDKRQLSKEGTDIGDADFGIVSILGQMDAIEQPLNPMTMIRNALGPEESGSGVSLDKEAYAKSVEFWNNNAAVKTMKVAHFCLDEPVDINFPVHRSGDEICGHDLRCCATVPHGVNRGDLLNMLDFFVAAANAYAYAPNPSAVPRLVKAVDGVLKMLMELTQEEYELLNKSDECDELDLALAAVKETFGITAVKT